MEPSSKVRAAEFYARTYDESVPDWPGEIDFYRRLASEARQNGERLLEIGCGTGRVAIRLAREGTEVVGLDLSPQMLDVAREKGKDLEGLRWVQASMCDFDLGEGFGVVIIPGHSFQCLNTPQEQAACMQCIYRHLNPGGRLVVHLDHQDFSWLAGLVGEKGGVFEPAEGFQDPTTGQQIRASRAWTYEPSTQTATCTTAWEAVGDGGRTVDRWQKEPVRLHCIFRFEMEHLLARTGFCVDDVYGDFFRNPLQDKSSDMIWVAHKPGAAS
ncbi:MAG: class I SAM-dependent methyltransferase [Bacteroidota bacterium]